MTCLSPLLQGDQDPDSGLVGFCGAELKTLGGARWVQIGAAKKAETEAAWKVVRGLALHAVLSAALSGALSDKCIPVGGVSSSEGATFFQE